jgi:hypothetical protein
MRRIARANTRKTTNSNTRINQFHHVSSGSAFTLSSKSSQFVVPPHSAGLRSNSATNNIRKAYVREQRYCAHRSHDGISSGDTKNPAKSICGTNRIGSISDANFGSSTLHPSITASAIKIESKECKVSCRTHQLIHDRGLTHQSTP